PPLSTLVPYPTLFRSRLRQQPVAKSVFPDVGFAPIAEGFGFEAATVRTLEDLHKVAPRLRKPDGPIFLDCKINADVAAPFMSERSEEHTSELQSLTNL